MKRSEAIEVLLNGLKPDDIALFSTGMISREAFNIRDREASFYMIGSMGLLSSIGLGIALSLPDRRVIVVEGDGSALMSLGSIPLIAHCGPQNLVHVVLDNEAYESTGNQPTITRTISLTDVAASGYHQAATVTMLGNFARTFEEFLGAPGPAFLLAKVTGPSSHDIGRIDIPPPALKERFRNAVIGRS